MDLNSSDLVIRPASRRELDLAVEWAAQEGWNPGLSDAECFYAADPKGFLLAFRDGEPVASISVVRYGSDLGFRIVGDALDPAETSHLLRTLEASPLARSRAGARHLMKHSAVSGPT